MVNLLRKYQQALMIIITILVIVAFVFLFNVNRSIDHGPGGQAQNVGKIYGRTISMSEAQREVRKLRIIQVLQLQDFADSLVGRVTSQDQAFSMFIWNSIVLRHEADRLKIYPTQDEVKVAIMGIHSLQTNGVFDSAKYTSFIEDMLAPNGFSASELEDIMRDDLRLQKIKALLNSTFDVPPEMYRAAYTHAYQKIDVSLIRFNLSDFASAVKISDDDVKKAYNEHPDNYKSEEQRSIKYVSFMLSDAEKKLTGPDRIEALKKLRQRVDDFTQAMLEKDAKFDNVAAKAGVTVTTTKPFPETNPDPKLEQTPAVIAAAFHLTMAEPDSDAIQAENGYYVVHLENIEPSRQLTLEEAKPKVTEELKNTRAHELLSIKASDVRNKIETDMKAGKSFADAATAAGQKVETFPPFSYAEPNFELPGAREIMTKALDLKDGQLSDLMETPDGGILVRLDKREPVDEAKMEKEKPLLAPRIAERELNVVFGEWLRKCRDDARIIVPRRQARQ